jgi:integrase/recombinase XerD
MAKRKISRSQEAKTITIGEAFTEFISEKELGGRAEKTLDNYRQSLIYFLDFNGFNEDTPIENLNKAAFLNYLAIMRKNEAKHTTINHYLRDVRTFAYWCMDSEREYITDTYKIEQVRGQEPALKAFKEDDISLLLIKPKKSETFGEWRTWAIVNWVMATGNRSSTICEVKIEDVNFKQKMIYLRHTKNKEYQAVPLSTELSHQLKEYLNLWLRGANPTDYLFPNVSGEKLSTNALRHSFAKYCKDRGVNQTNLHGLRHSFADISLDTGRNPFELQKMLGHSTLDMTRKYIRYNEKKIEKDFDKHTPLDNLKKPTSRKRKIQRAQ